MVPMTRIWERLYIGNRIDAECLAKSNPYAITTVITLCEEPVIQRSPGINYLHHPIQDDHFLVQAALDAVGYKSIDAALEEIAEQRPIVSPSSTLLAAVRSVCDNPLHVQVCTSKSCAVTPAESLQSYRSLHILNSMIYYPL